MLTDFFVADLADAAVVAIARPAARKWAAWFAKDLDKVKLARLWSAIHGTSEECLPATPLLHAHSDDGPWVYEVPAPLVERLAALEDTDLQPVAAAWAEAEEFARDAWQTADVLEALSQLRMLCVQARAAGKALLSRVSL
jgi:hypothetical protein